MPLNFREGFQRGSPDIITTGSLNTSHWESNKTHKHIFSLALAFIELSRADIPQDNREQPKSACGRLQFRCHNGQCIDSDKLCDGRADCDDGSDETREECTKPEIICPDFAFRCNYGACVDGDAPCNGITDCVDKSDEQLPRCRTLSPSNGTCSNDQFRCNNGQCIQNTEICDGKIDCTDGSDETFALCSGVQCEPFTFRCAYGACIHNRLKCNGVRDCGDGSDEDPSLCRGISAPRPVEPPQRQPPSSGTQNRRNCPLPKQPLNGRWLLHKSQCRNNDHCTVRSTADLPPGTQLVYSCNTGYKVEGSTLRKGDVYCGPQGKWSDEPVCVEIRCRPLTTATTIASCTRNGNWTSCEVPVLPNTVARLSCQNSYRKDANVLSRQRENVRCNLQGQWEPEPIKCVAECGLVRPNLKPYIVNPTSRPSLPEFPWHASLYIMLNPEDPEDKRFICGASIIQSNLLITAAHCVYDETFQRVQEPNTFFIATGNLFQNYKHPFNRFVQTANVSDIYVNCHYNGEEGNYATDIAIIRIDRHFTFSATLMPICIDDVRNNDYSELEVGKIGKVAGFGRTGPNASQASSQILLSLSVPVVSTSECQTAAAKPKNTRLITDDKFCAGYTNGSAVCDGDSGGGLAFNMGGLYYLRGIVSSGISLVRVGGVKICDSDTYALFTRVSSYIEWIKDVLLRLELYDSYPTCLDRSALRTLN